MVFKWRDDQTLLFLEELKNVECLWYNKCEEYKNRTSRENAIKTLISALNLPGVTESDVKAKIKTIRTRYSSELSKVKKSERSGAGREDIYVPKLFWFRLADSFLRGVCVPRKSTSNLDVKSKTVNVVHEERSNEEEQSHNTKEIDDNTEETESATREVWKTPARKRASCSAISSVEKAISTLQTISNENRAAENEFDFFCKSLAIQLKNMPLDRALICQEKLLSVMVQERLYQLGTHLHPTTQHSASPQMSFLNSPYSSSTPSLNTHMSNPMPPTRQERGTLSEDQSLVDSQSCI